MKDFLVIINSEKDLIEGIINLNNIGALGSKISYGTYLLDSYYVSDIINKDIGIFDKHNICAFSISYDDDEYRNSNFPDLYGKNHIQISLATKYDIEMRDVSENLVHYTKIIEETQILIKAFS